MYAMSLYMEGGRKTELFNWLVDSNDIKINAMKYIVFRKLLEDPKSRVCEWILKDAVLNK